ncbi:MAG: TIGR02757 family protein [Candidatus Melainabacteria bacterium GWF2_37_15]|nr:MAG: TIGR02757 family protein [Candidatus Melainabacteria bacterium GWF2_37_15]
MTEIKVSKRHLDTLVRKFEIPEFIKDDPVQFPHQYEGKLDIEVSGFLSSVFAFGNRKKIIENLELIHEIINPDPFEFVVNFDMDRDAILLTGFKYRFYQEKEVVMLINAMSQIFKQYGSLENAFMTGFSPDHYNVKEGLIAFVNLFREYLPVNGLVPSPENGSACKRLNLFLKWMVRGGPVDLGVWENIPTSKLVIPLDTHVAQISRMWGLTERKADDWRTAEEITNNLKCFDPDDPVKYDFALFGTGVGGVI